MLFNETTLTLHADRFDVPHHLLLLSFTLHGHVRGHQDQLLGVGELEHAAHFPLLCLFMLIVLICHMSYFDTYALQVHVRGHQDQLPVVGELLLAAHCIFFESSCQSFSCPT